MNFNYSKPLLSEGLILSASISNEKETTYCFEMIELHSLQELMQLMNSKAVSSGLYMNGHRHSNYLKAVGNVYLIDIDLAPTDNEAPYYQTIETKLKELDVSFVSVPSQSADKYPYKRHIAVILDSLLPTGSKAFRETSAYILKYIGVDVNKIDMGVAVDNVRQLAPASINKNFTNIAEVSYSHQAKPLALPKAHQSKNIQVGDFDVDTNCMITFTDKTILSIYDAKNIVNAGTHKSCYCPNPKHNDKNPSATFYHNQNGSVKIYCATCKDIKISTNFIPTVPSITHEKYNYSIVINKSDTSHTSNLITKIGKCTLETDKNLIWCFNVSNMNDIYILLLAKANLIDNGFHISHYTPIVRPEILLNTDILKPLTVNQTLFTPYIQASKSLSAFNYRYLHVKQYIQRKSYLFAEVCIYTTFQNIINPDRDFNTTCNLGLAYFEYVLKTQKKQRNFKSQNLKTFPMRLNGTAKAKANTNRMKKVHDTQKLNMNTKQKQLVNLLNNPIYLKVNGQINKSAIAKKLMISRTTLDKYLKVINLKREQ